MKQIDCRGLACPQPVITTKKALEEMGQGQLTVIVDNPSARDNVERFAQSQGATVNIEKKGNDFFLHIQKNSPCELTGSALKSENEKVVVYISSCFLGIGEETLGSMLIRSFLHVLTEMEPKPTRMIFINSGVRLTSEGSEVLDDLRSLAEKGVAILSCGTCLDFYDLKEKLKVGVISNMYDIAKSLFEAERLIRP